MRMNQGKNAINHLTTYADNILDLPKGSCIVVRCVIVLCRDENEDEPPPSYSDEPVPKKKKIVYIKQVELLLNGQPVDMVMFLKKVGR